MAAGLVADFLALPFPEADFTFSLMMSFMFSTRFSISPTILSEAAWHELTTSVSPEQAFRNLSLNGFSLIRSPRTLSRKLKMSFCSMRFTKAYYSPQSKGLQNKTMKRFTGR